MCIYATSIRILAKGSLPISLVMPSKLREILNDVKTSNLKEFINSYTNHKGIFDLQERHGNMELNANKTFFLKITLWSFSCSLLQ